MDAGPLNLVRPEVPVELAAVVAKMMAKEPTGGSRRPARWPRPLTPFFKKGNAAFKSPEADVSRAGRTNAARPAPAAVLRRAEPVVEAAVCRGAGRPRESRWESLIEIPGAEARRKRNRMSGRGRRRWPIPSRLVFGRFRWRLITASAC